MFFTWSWWDGLCLCSELTDLSLFICSRRSERLYAQDRSFSLFIVGDAFVLINYSIYVGSTSVKDLWFFFLWVSFPLKMSYLDHPPQWCATCRSIHLGQNVMLELVDIYTLVFESVDWWMFSFDTDLTAAQIKECIRHPASGIISMTLPRCAFWEVFRMWRL